VNRRNSPLADQGIPLDLKVGEPVSWSSQAGGNVRHKTGFVFAEIPSKTDAGNVIRAAEQAGTHRSTYGGGIPRNHVSYVIVVPAKTSKGLPVLYWPVASNLRRVA